MHIILLHGWGGSSESLKPLDAILKSNGFITHRLEMPGHGLSPDTDRPWRMSDFSTWVLEYINENKINSEELILVGHSFGGKIILDLTSRKLLQPKSLVLIDVSGIKPEFSLKILILKVLSKIFKFLEYLPFGKKVKYLFYKKIVREGDYYKTSGNLRETLKNVLKENYDDRLNLIKVPSLIIWGKDDLVTPLAMAETLHKNIIDSKLVILEGTHGLPLKNPTSVAKEIIDYLKPNERNTRN